MIRHFCEKFFQKINKPKSISEKEDGDIFSFSDENAFGISLDETGERFIRFNLQKTSDQDAVYFAELLFGIHNGIYEIQSLEMLEDITKMNDKDAAAFASKVLVYYHKYQEILNNKTPITDDDPIVAPSAYLKLAREKNE